MRVGVWCFILAFSHARGSFTLEGLDVQIKATLGDEVAGNERLDFTLETQLALAD